MKKQNIGFLHPGAMGISLAATALNSGYTPFWVSENRSTATYERAQEQGLKAVQDIGQLTTECDLIISVCPPHAAMDVAKQVLAADFSGTYADVNAISPQHVKEINTLMVSAGVTFVDGGIIGPPAWQPDTTYLYLSGPAAKNVAECFSAGPLVTEVIGDSIGKASALKMCFAANSKGTTALLCSIMAAAEKMGVRQELEKQWSRNGSTYTTEVISGITQAAAKAWRFSGEMEEIAATLAAAGLPEGFHLAAQDIYSRLSGFKDCESKPSLNDILSTLIPREPC